LHRKLWRIPNTDMVSIDASLGQLVDRNYYPLKAGIEISDKGDVLKSMWRSEGFDKLCKRLKTLEEPKISDIIFYLLDFDGDTRENLVKFILQTKKKTLQDYKSHNFSIPPNKEDRKGDRVGVTYFSLNSDDLDKLKKRLLTLAQARKYKSKGDVWIGFGSLRSSDEIIDLIVYIDEPWEYDKEEEDHSKALLGDNGHGTMIRIGKKVGRNELCPCGSGLKYKKCCIQ